MPDSPRRFDELKDGAFGDTFVSYGALLRFGAVVVAYLALFAGVVYGYRQTGEDILVLAGREIALLDWVSVSAVGILLVIVAPPIARDPTRITRFLRTYARDRVATIALAYLVALGVIATVGPVVLGRPEVHPVAIYQPPVGFSVESYVPVSCLGDVRGDRCFGTLSYPLGTDEGGRNLVTISVYGLRTSLQIGVSAAVITAGIGTTVGLVAGTIRGRVGAVLMRYVDIQTAVPAFFVYVLVVAILWPDLVLMVVVFGLLGWGGFARVVRSEVIRVRDEQYVQAATAAGAGTVYQIRRHVLPNAASGVLVPATTLVPQFILYEAALSFLGLGESNPLIISLGSEIDAGLDHTYTEWWTIWWQPVVPALVLTTLVCAILVVGDRTSDVLDPRGP